MGLETNIDQNLRLGYLGPAGTFTEMAAQVLKQEPGYEETSLLAAPSIVQLCDLVDSGVAELAILPYYNSVGGPVKDTFEELQARDLIIRGELDLKIVQCLFMQEGVSVDEIKEVRSKDQALSQTALHLDAIFGPENLEGKGHKRVPINSTAQAVLEAAKNPGIAAVAGANAAEALFREGDITEDEYRRLSILEGIQDSDNNMTRFIVVQRPGMQTPEPTDHDITTFLVSLENQPGSLYKCLDIMAGSGINLTKIKSFGVKNEEVSFLMSAEGHQENDSLAEVLNHLRGSARLKMLGSYPRSNHMNPEHPDAPSIDNAVNQVRKRLVDAGESASDQSALVMTLNHKVGALRDVLKLFAEQEIDLVDIDSLPTGRGLEEHIFYLIYKNDGSVKSDDLLSQLQASCSRVAFVGV